MDNKKAILKLLCENARYTDKQIGVMLGLEEKKVSALIKEMENNGDIVKYSAIVGTKPQKNNVEALIEVKVNPQQLKGFDSCAEEIYSMREVKSLYLMSGGFDLAVFISGESLSDIAKFVSEKLSVIDGIVSVATHFILKKYKVEGQITVKEENKRQIIGA